MRTSIEVDEQDPSSAAGESGTEVEGRRLADPTLLVDDRRHHRLSRRWRGRIGSAQHGRNRALRDPVVAPSARAAELASPKVAQDGLLVDRKAVGDFLGGE